MERIYQAMLLTAPGIGSLKLKKLVEYYGDAQTVWSLQQKTLLESKILSAKEMDGLVLLRERTDIEETLERWTQMGVHICSLDDKEYPNLLRNIFDPPPLLFYRGHIHGDSLYLAVVGSRRSTPYGRNVAHSFCEKLARSGVTIVSGAAKGIDAAAHEGALAAGSGTVAVLGCGVDIVYPAENAHLLKHIPSMGCLISEYPPGTPPTPGQFPARNRIVAGMSVGVLVVEAAEKSGALITADFALNENREVFAVPGSIFSNVSRGAHRLIQQGARLVGSAEDLLDELGLSTPSPAGIVQEALGVASKNVLNEISYEHTVAVDELVRRLKMDVSQLAVILLQLELAGYVVKNSGAGYSRVAKE